MRKWTSALVVLALSAGIAPAWPRVAPAGLVVSGPAVEAHGLRSLSVRDPESGAAFRVFYDPASETIARESLPVLASFYDQISDLVAVDASAVAWADILFARNAKDLLLPRTDGQVLWRVDVDDRGRLDAAGLEMLYLTIPHEQVHATQATLPRWFAEGQAEWAGLQVSRRWKPQLERHERERLAQALASSTGPLALSSWGGVQPKMEAILRQLTPEQRTQFLEDPASVPLRAMTFGPGDLVSDESNTKARYAGALALFERIEDRAGRAALQAWFRAARGEGVSGTPRLAELARELTGTDPGPHLK